MPVDEAAISRCFRLLANADPRLYEKLIRLCDQRVSEVTVAVTEVAPEQILVAQGRAREARKFFQLMTEFPPDPPQAPQAPAV